MTSSDSDASPAAGLDVSIVAALAEIAARHDLSEVEVDHNGLKIRVARERYTAPIVHTIAAPAAPVEPFWLDPWACRDYFCRNMAWRLWADQAFAGLGEGNDGGGGARALFVGDHFGLAAFEDGDAGVGGSEIDTDDFCHVGGYLPVQSRNFTYSEWQVSDLLSSLGE